MNAAFTEKRQHVRRHLEYPVAFASDGDAGLDLFSIGSTIDVSPRGVSVRADGDRLPHLGSPVELRFIPGSENGLLSVNNTAVRIRGTVVWANSDRGRFGVCFD